MCTTIAAFLQDYRSPVSLKGMEAEFGCVWRVLHAQWSTLGDHPATKSREACPETALLAC